MADVALLEQRDQLVAQARTQEVADVARRDALASQADGLVVHPEPEPVLVADRAEDPGRVVDERAVVEDPDAPGLRSGPRGRRTGSTSLLRFWLFRGSMAIALIVKSRRWRSLSIEPGSTVGSTGEARGSSRCEPLRRRHARRRRRGRPRFRTCSVRANARRAGRPTPSRAPIASPSTTTSTSKFGSPSTFSRTEPPTR